MDPGKYSGRYPALHVDLVPSAAFGEARSEAPRCPLALYEDVSCSARQRDLKLT